MKIEDVKIGQKIRIPIEKDNRYRPHNEEEIKTSEKFITGTVISKYSTLSLIDWKSNEKLPDNSWFIDNDIRNNYKIEDKYKDYFRATWVNGTDCVLPASQNTNSAFLPLILSALAIGLASSKLQAQNQINEEN
jgi:hypothetical protein